MGLIYKYPLRLTDTQNVVMPRGARILTVQMQNAVPTLWAEVDPTDSVGEQRHITIIGTGNGHTSPHSLYLGTVQDGPFVWHVFEDRI